MASRKEDVNNAILALIKKPGSDKVKKRKVFSDEENEIIETLDKYGPDLMGDAADRARLMQMSEVQREEILYERNMARQRAQEKEELARKFRAAPISGKKSQLDNLKASREERKHDLEKVADNEAKKLLFEPEENQKPASVDFETICKMVVTRDQIDSWINLPNVDSLITGCLARTLLNKNKNEPPKYRIFEIGGLRESLKTYKIVRNYTKKEISLRMGTSPKNKRLFNIIAISNSPPTPAEFDSYKLRLRQVGAELCSLEAAKRAIERINKLNESLNSELVNKDIEVNKALRKQKHNTAQEKAVLLIRREEAAQDGDEEQVAAIDARIDEIDHLVENTGKPDVWSALNDRNRKANIEGMIEAEKAEPSEMQTAFDPFSRRRTQPSSMHTVEEFEQVQQDVEESNEPDIPDVVDLFIDVDTSLCSYQPVEQIPRKRIPGVIDLRDYK